jgi:probable phosphoglycerate mutase
MNRTTHILLIRHGQTDANAQGQLQGHQPTPLNRAGVRQANLLAERLAGYSPPVEMIISSDLPRATETAAPIAAACGLRLAIDPAWRERSFGLLEGKPVGDKKMWEVASGEMDPPGTEPAADLRRRIRDALIAVPLTYPNKQLITVVTHGGPIRAVLRMLADGELPITRGHHPVEVAAVPNCSILHLIARNYSDGIRWKIEAVNDVSHLKTDWAV